jgi:hypothetical protein
MAAYRNGGRKDSDMVRAEQVLEAAQAVVNQRKEWDSVVVNHANENRHGEVRLEDGRGCNVWVKGPEAEDMARAIDAYYKRKLAEAEDELERVIDYYRSTRKIERAIDDYKTC